MPLVWTCRPVFADIRVTLTLLVNPTMPALTLPVMNGQVVATMSAVFSDGSPFTGTFAFVAPNFNHGGDYAITGNQLVVNNATNLNAIGSVTTEHVTMIAQQ